MKKFFTIVCAAFLGISVGVAGMSESKSESISELTMASSRVNVPTGVYFNGTDFIKVESSWIRICINSQSKEYDFDAEMDPYGNYVLKFGYGDCITIYSGGRSLSYNGTTYSKKQY
ncbi:MAG: hypothetical protein K2K47_08620 [Duncaniella sp.]|nr:hypothetical protein [Duncaniella sp.]